MSAPQQTQPVPAVRGSRSALVAVLAIGFTLPMFATQNQAPPSPASRALLKLAEPWPDEQVLRERKAAAENRALFRSFEPVEFTIESDFGAVNRDRNPESTRRYPAAIRVAELSSGEAKSVAVEISARGHLRRMSRTCDFVPLRLEFAKGATRGTVFEGPSETLKLVTHCRTRREHDQYILREHLAYRLSNILTPRSFRSRLAKVTYVESKSGKILTTRYGILLEDDDDVARRMQGRIVDLERTMFDNLDSATLTMMMVFEYMIGNTDLSIFGLHNARLIQTPDRKLYPVPYDFDLSGLVDAPYAVADPRFKLGSVKERLYRGPCRTPEDLDQTFQHFRQRKDALLAEADAVTDLDDSVQRDVRDYLSEFFATIDRPSNIKRVFIDKCAKTTM